MANDLYFIGSKAFIMAKEKYEKHEQKGNEDAAVKPDQETLNTTDPQEHMSGPFSSLMKGTEKTFEKQGGKTSDDE